MGPKTELVHRYFDRCTNGTPEELAELFTEDAVVYDRNVRPVRGADEIETWWSRIRQRWQGARWSVDTSVEEGDAVAVEWTMKGRTDGTPFTVRGSDHYAFRGDRISEVRQYWTFDPRDPGSELIGFPYADDPRFRTVP
jgi:ketosteroid isomerase-like protein